MDTVIILDTLYINFAFLEIFYKSTGLETKRNAIGVIPLCLKSRTRAVS